ncbi:hypothetical protein GA0070624_1159 [Micromonospora rhizosphaerae]|uniref:Uncharacterized protein n=1 Tax=Micromonospora rhizosphaerae TaxID=568872 RepID=A0A1C6RIM6_9ACTN|nr:hypothetical protein [Micromonospora rhizosphaerae]SCL16903.1 hypothetical protein GA0070624_1159 [Micromonospora rhizosphaerae]
MQNQPGGAPPVFVDRTGRRRRLTVIAGTVMGVGLLTSLGLILAGLFFDSSVSLPGWSETKEQPPIEAGVDAPGGRGDHASPSPGPAPATSTSVPVPSLSPTSAGGSTATTRSTAPAPQPSGSTVPGQGDERRSTAKPSRTPGKP